MGDLEHLNLMNLDLDQYNVKEELREISYNCQNYQRHKDLY